MRPSLLHASTFAMVSMFLMPTIAWSDPILASWNGRHEARLSYADYDENFLLLGQSTGGFLLQGGNTGPWAFGADAALVGDGSAIVAAQTYHTGTVGATGLTASGYFQGQAPGNPDQFDDSQSLTDGSLQVGFVLPGAYRYSYRLNLFSSDQDTLGWADFEFPAINLFVNSSEGNNEVRSGQGQFSAGSYDFTVSGHGESFQPPGGGLYLSHNYSYDFALNLTPVPEPSTFLLLGLGGLGALVRARRRIRDGRPPNGLWQAETRTVGAKCCTATPKHARDTSRS